jgi:hypothetical protein
MNILVVLSLMILSAPRGPQAVDPKTREAVKRALQDLAQGKGDLEKLRVTWNDLQGLHGGLRLTIQGDGKITQEVVRAEAGKPKEKVEAKDLQALVDKLIAHEAWAQRVPERPPVPDESRAKLTITVGADSVTVWEWYNDLAANKRLVEIRDLMQKIAWK